MDAYHFERQLESDDEFPDEYDEIPDDPAYKNSSRFDAIHFPWINNIDNVDVEIKPQTNTIYFNEDMLLDKTKELQFGEKTLIMEGRLSKRDIFCLTCIEETSTDALLLWFLHYLLYKDLHKNSIAFKSCLVTSLIKNMDDNYSSASTVVNENKEKKQHKFDIIVKEKSDEY